MALSLRLWEQTKQSHTPQAKVQLQLDTYLVGLLIAQAKVNRSEGLIRAALCKQLQQFLEFRLEYFLVLP